MAGEWCGGRKVRSMVAAVAEAIGSSKLHKQILGDSPSKRDVLNQVQEQGVEFIDLQFTDVMGHVKSVTIPSSIFEHVIDGGQWIDGSSIAGFTRIAESDMFLTPDLSTFAVIPWTRGEHTTARVICWVHNPDGTPFPGDPRGVLLRQLERLAELGYSFKTGPELEFFLFEKNGDEISPLPDRAGYFDYSSDLAYTVRKDMVKALEDMGIDVEASHHEVATGQHEIDFEYGDAIVTADRATTFKSVLKATAQQHGLHATFMPKPIEGINGSGMHVHMSLGFVDKKGNAFVDEDDAYGLSKTARHFIAGLLTHAAACPACSRRWSTHIAAWCRASRLRSTSPGRALTARHLSACRPFAGDTPRPHASSYAARIPPAIPTWPSR